MILLPVMLGVSAKKPGSAFALSNYSGLKAWYDASQIVGLSDGGAIASLSDLSGQSRTLSQGTGSKQPIYKTGILNGLPIMRFAHTSAQVLTGSDTGLPTGDTTVVLVIKTTKDMSSNGTYMWPFAYGTNSTNKLVLALIGAVTAYGGASLWGATQSGDSGPDWSTWSANSKSCYNVANVLMFTKTGNTWTFYKSTTTSNRSKTMTAATQLGGGLSFGGYAGAGADYVTGDIGEFAIWDRVLSGAEIAAVMSGLGTKWGVTINT